MNELAEQIRRVLNLDGHDKVKGPEAVPYDQWPLWAKALKQFWKPEDKGIGDVIRRTVGEENSDKFKAWYKKTTGKDCGCAGRQARWNIMYPFKTSEH